MTALVISIGIWSHLVLLLYWIALTGEEDKSVHPSSEFLIVTALFGAIFFWSQIIQWWLA
jgi:hypothetical protein